MRPGSFDPAPLCQPTTAQELRTALRVAVDPPRPARDGGAPAACQERHALRFGLQRVKCKPGRKLTLTYDLTVGGSPGRPLTVTWFAPALAEAALGEADHRLEDEARRRQVAQPFDRLSTAVPELGLRIQVSPFDPDFGQLVRLADPGHVSTMLETAIGRRWARPQVGWVRYRPGQRHVLRYGGSEGQRPIVFAKLHRGDRRPPATAEAMAEVLAAAAPAVTAAPMVATVEDDGVELWAHQPGTPLSQLICQGAPVDVALGRTGTALRRLHEAPPRRFGVLPHRDLDGEVRVTRRAAHHVGQLLPATGARIDEVLDRADADRATTVPAVVHGDLKADHLLVDGDRLSLVDFDSCAVGRAGARRGQVPGRPALLVRHLRPPRDRGGPAGVPPRLLGGPHRAGPGAELRSGVPGPGGRAGGCRSATTTGRPGHPALADDAGGLLGERVA